MMLRPFALLVLLLFSAPSLAADQPSLFDLLKQKPYLSAWQAMLKGEKIDPWLAKYAKTFDDPASPATSVPVGGETYTLADVCKAHDCGDNHLHVLFAPGGEHAWGLLVTGGDHRRWLGNPDAAIQAAIQSGVK